MIGLQGLERVTQKHRSDVRKTHVRAFEAHFRTEHKILNFDTQYVRVSAAAFLSLTLFIFYCAHTYPSQTLIIIGM